MRNSSGFGSVGGKLALHDPFEVREPPVWVFKVRLRDLTNFYCFLYWRSRGFISTRMDGVCWSLAKMPFGTGFQLEATFARVSAASFYHHGTWLSLSPWNLSSSLRTSWQHAAIFRLTQVDSFMT